MINEAENKRSGGPAILFEKISSSIKKGAKSPFFCPAFLKHNMVQKKRQIANIIFFLRYLDPREPDLDLLDTFRKQNELVKRYGFPATFLIEYDSLIDPIYQKVLLQDLAPNCEIGGWFEIVQPLVEKAGLVWRGRVGYPWDWHANVGFSVGYTKEERKRLADVFMEEYFKVFGKYPKSVGSWLIDAFTLNYMQERYGITASCNCRDQWGTDGYTLWGGYYGQGYYPSKKNVLCPANTIENQIPVPVFRMLGSDPIYQYDFGLNNGSELAPSADQGVVTLEPVYNGQEGGGGVPSWVSWYLKENFNPETCTFNYTQVGQENSFGWERMKEGLEDQFKQLQEMRDNGQIELATLEEIGDWYRSQFSMTAPTSISAQSDWKEEGRKTLWYDCMYYRTNLYQENNRIWIRDIHLFREDYKERYLETVCQTKDMCYDNLPVVDGNRWSKGSVRAGLYFYTINTDGEKRELLFDDWTFHYPDHDIVVAKATGPDGVLQITLDQTGILIQYDGGPLFAWIRTGAVIPLFLSVTDKTVRMIHNDFSYEISISGGRCLSSESSAELQILSDIGKLKLNLGKEEKVWS